MPKYIHSIRTKAGKELFRLFSTISDEYVTPELSEGQLIDFLVSSVAGSYAEYAIADIIDLNGRIERARATGTSAFEEARSKTAWLKGSCARWSRTSIEMWLDTLRRQRERFSNFEQVKEWILACPITPDTK
jgi:hypothetical protein